MALGDRTRTDEFGVPIVSEPVQQGLFPTSPSVARPVGMGLGVGGGLTRANDPYQFDTFPGDVTDVTPTGLPGSPMKTLYGVDSESYLTDDQRKLARQIQGKFDQSVGFRDRELNRYGAPRLASFTEDEALARAMSLARGLNFPEAAAEDTTVPGGIGRLATPSPMPRPPAAAPAPPPSVPRDRYAEWAKVLTGLTSIAGLLFGRNAYGEFINKGAIKSVQDWWKGITGTDASEQQLEQVVKQYGNPYGAGSGWGQDVLQTPYGPGSGWGQDVLQTPGSTDWWNVSGGESAITTPLAPEIPVVGVPDTNWFDWGLGGPGE